MPATVSPFRPINGLVASFVSQFLDALAGLGDWAKFCFHTMLWLFTRRPDGRVLVSVCYMIGVNSVGVVVVTGTFIGMVLAVQSIDQFRLFGLQSWVGAMIHTSVIRELGPVLAATMLAGRVGSAMAAELGTMRVTEQIDALACLGANPIHHLVVPRFLACVLLIPLLTVFADLAGIFGGTFISVWIYGIDAHFFWEHSQRAVRSWDLFCGFVKPIFFGGAIALISCHRGFRSRAGAVGVGRAATESF
jgi:phospholipid/cholesterol/gamma-HCH transport system permease protein